MHGRWRPAGPAPMGTRPRGAVPPAGPSPAPPRFWRPMSPHIHVGTPDSKCCSGDGASQAVIKVTRGPQGGSWCWVAVLTGRGRDCRPLCLPREDHEKVAVCRWESVLSSPDQAAP